MLFKRDGQEYEVGQVLNRMEFMATIRRIQEQIKDDLVFKNHSLTVYTKTHAKIELSKGCQACKEGAWVCLFVGNRCNAKCEFCPQAKDEKTLHMWEHPRTISNYWIDDIKMYLEMFECKVKGVSYSGGEPFLYLDKVLEIAQHLHKRTPSIYQWIYTNGYLVDDEKLKQLKEQGIQEIRFDLVASHFSELVVKKLERAKRIIGKVTVEIPAIPETFDKLINEHYLERLINSGVEQLNLGEQELVQPINYEKFAKKQDVYIYDTVFSEAIAPTHSRLLTLAIMKYSTQRKFNLLINDCSLDAKHLQGLQRHEKLPKILQ